MPENSVCPQCGAAVSADAPAGLCLRCLARLGAGTLLSSTDQSGSLHEQPQRLVPGEVVGDYELLEEIGHGGMGVVYKARQRSLNRLVALKVIKPGMDSERVLARFEAERQALALMDHPNIAHVFDAGVTALGRPYFAMELVDGVPITQFCDGQRLTIRERLELFICICLAMQHAHQKGIIHRDLKPSNVLVTLHDGIPVPKVIDFGVAKAIGQPLTDEAFSTQIGALIGTLQYMSPEQTALNGLDIDTRSDIFALGTLLYELLTGTTPLTVKTLKEAALYEVVQRIRQEEPPRPSTRLGETHDALAVIAARRNLEPARLAKIIHGDLDWIVLRALEKDRDRRYDTAHGLATDIQRFLNDETVQARPQSAGYRLHKLIRRNKLPFAAAGGVVAALLLGFIVSAVMFLRERAARHQAAEQTEIAGAVQDFLETDLLRQADSRNQASAKFEPDPDLTVRAALHRAAGRIGDRFKDRPLIEAAIRLSIGDSFLGVGQPLEALPQLERALKLRQAILGTSDPVTLQAMFHLARGYGEAGKSEQAIALLEKTLTLREAKLGPDHLDTLRTISQLAQAYQDVGRPDKSIAVAKEALERARAKLGPYDPVTLSSMNTLGIAYGKAGKLDQALPLLEEHLEILRTNLPPKHPDLTSAMNNLAMAYGESRKYEKAVRLLEDTLAMEQATLGSEHPSTLGTMNNLAFFYQAVHKRDQAARLLAVTLDGRRSRLGPEHPETLATFGNLIGCLLGLSNYTAAESLLREYLDIYRRKTPDSWKAFDAASSLGSVLLNQKKYSEAESLLVEGYCGLKEREAQIPKMNFRKPLKQAIENLVQLYEQWGKPEEEARWRSKLTGTNSQPAAPNP